MDRSKTSFHRKTESAPTPNAQHPTPNAQRPTFNALTLQRPNSPTPQLSNSPTLQRPNSSTP
ncbi:MAG: hypothetical protein AAGD25_25335 [Cyanobacteria bacterium P01_F01_bin.150]